MGFETHESKAQRYRDTILDRVPMGFETMMIWRIWAKRSILDRVPMGFETIRIKCRQGSIMDFRSRPYGIWNSTFSKSGFRTIKHFRSRPYGIWNTLIRRSYRTVCLILDRVPMGFETRPGVSTLPLLSDFRSRPYGIWNWTILKIENFKGNFRSRPYGIWNRYERQANEPLNAKF